MRLPFNLDLKSLIVGALLAYFLVPFLMGLMNRGTNRNVVRAAA